jgi:mannose-1-phosphate guanylyltransferase/mannose-6-phosphate isomerase/murein biosynthesis integral membrane protein MurJ
MDGTQKSAAKTALALTLISAASKVLGLLRESTLASYFGASAQTDAYKLAYGIPFLLLAMITTSIATTFIPVYTGYVKNKTKEQSIYFVNNITNLVAIASLVLTGLGMAFSPFLIKLMAPGFKTDTLSLATELTVIMLPALIFIALSNLSNGFLQTNGSFIPAALMWIPYNVIIITSIVLFSHKSIKIVAAGSFLATASMFAVQIPSMLKAGYRFKPVLDFREEGLRKVLILILPILVSSIFDQVYILIDRMLASGFNAGSLSSLDFADKVNNLVYNILIISVVTVIYPGMASISDNTQKFVQMVERGIRVVLLISIPAMTCLFILKTPVVNILFERGAFNTENTYITSAALGYFSLGITGMGMRETLNRAFYSAKDTRTPMINGITAICINIALNFLFAKFLGVGGLALSASVTATISCTMLLIRFNRKIGSLGLNRLAVLVIKTAIASAGMGIIVYLLNEMFYIRYLNTPILVRLVKLLMIMSAGGITYIWILLLLKIEDLDFILALIRNKIKFRFKTGETFSGAKINYGTVNKNDYGGKNMDRYALIMAGGNGVRFWPFSREQMPKQFLHLTGEDTMLNETIKRIDGVVNLSNVFIVANNSQCEVTMQMVHQEISRKNIFFEPESKNTAACIAYGATRINMKCKEALMCILPADHYIKDVKCFQEVLEQAFNIAESTGKIVVIGIKPDYPSTGYGYIKCGDEYCISLDMVYQVDEFVEKPDYKKASNFLERGGYVWNSGIIVCKASSMLNNITRYLPRVHRTITKVKDFIGTPKEQEILEAIYAELPSVSIDYGVMERSDDLLVMIGDFDWSDVGSWDSLYSIYKPDKDNNIIKAKYIGIDTSNSVIFGGDRLVSTIGVDSLIVVECGDALLICHKDRAQEVKRLVEKMGNTEFKNYL